MTEKSYRKCLDKITELVAKGEYERACRLRDFLKDRGYRVPIVGRDNDSEGLDLIGKMYANMKAGIEDIGPMEELSKLLNVPSVNPNSPPSIN